MKIAASSHSYMMVFHIMNAQLREKVVFGVLQKYMMMEIGRHGKFVMKLVQVNSMLEPTAIA